MHPFLCYSDKQIGADGNPNLGVNSIAGGSVKGLYFEVLLDPLEKQLDVPSFPIEFGYGDGRELKIVGDETVDNACCEVLVSDHPEVLRIFS